MTDESEIIKMDHPEFGSVRGVIEDGKMLFFVSDLCQRLWVRDRSEAVSQVSEEDIKAIHIDTDRGVRGVQVVNEYGLYALAGRATNDRTLEFMRWLCTKAAEAVEASRVVSIEVPGKDLRSGNLTVPNGSVPTLGRPTLAVTAGNPNGAERVRFVAAPVAPPFSPDFPDVWRPAPAAGQVKTMPSLEIAELTGKRHDNVMRDIKTTLEQAGIDALRFEGTYLDTQNRERPCYHLPRRECDLLISGYSVPYRLAIIDRWMELEAESFPVPRSFEEALRLAADLVGRNHQLETQNEEMAPKAKIYDIAMASDGLLGFKEVCSPCLAPFRSPRTSRASTPSPPRPDR